MKLAKKRPEEHTENMYYAKLCFGRAASLGFFPGQMVLVVLKVDELEARKSSELEQDKENQTIPNAFKAINQYIDVHGTPAYYYKAYVLTKIAEHCLHDPKSIKAYYMKAFKSIHVADALKPYCEAGILNASLGRGCMR